MVEIVDEKEEVETAVKMINPNRQILKKTRYELILQGKWK